MEGIKRMGAKDASVLSLKEDPQDSWRTLPLTSISQNLVTWPHLLPKDLGKCSLLIGQLIEQEENE
jgi:hypothetical protein